MITEILPFPVFKETKSSNTTVFMATKSGRMVSYLDWLPPIVVQHFRHGDLQDHMTNQNHYISTTIVPMVTKLGRMITYFGGVLSIKSNNPLIMWSC